jgi:hypothetical protein
MAKRKKKKNYFNLTRCILIHDAKVAPEERFNSIRGFAIHLKEKGIMTGTLSSIYSKLYRYENDGFYKKPQDITKSILKIFDIREGTLIKKSKP